jgi:poly(3-hydroxybutyrate) depolymerase
MRLALFLLLCGLSVAEELPRGQILDSVPCLRDPTESYALYVPSNYTADREWPVIFAFDPGARGRTPVVVYQAAAERFGYIVAGSNTSRNSSGEATGKAIPSMTGDIFDRYRIDMKRVYFAGMSGGARVANSVALSSGKITGVIASSAGFPDGKLRKTIPYVLFGTAGTEDFNYMEMRTLSGALSSPHRIQIFEGGHVWLPPELAEEAIGFMELQGMKSGARTRDDALIESIYASRVAKAEKERDPLNRTQALEAIVYDFVGLRDVQSIAAKAVALRKDNKVKDAEKKLRQSDESEARSLGEILLLEAGLQDKDKRPDTLLQLSVRLHGLKRTAERQEDSLERRVSRRLLRALASRGITDPEYQKILAEVRLPGR